MTEAITPSEPQSSRFHNEIDMDAYWMPFTGNRAFKRSPRLIESAAGMYYRTVDGAKIMDNVQWKWLNDNLMDKNIDLHLIVSSTQVLREDIRSLKALVGSICELNDFAHQELGRRVPDETRIFKKALEVTRNVVRGSEIVDVRLLDQDTDELYFAATHGEAWRKGGATPPPQSEVRNLPCSRRSQDNSSRRGYLQTQFPARYRPPANQAQGHRSDYKPHTHT